MSTWGFSIQDFLNRIPVCHKVNPDEKVNWKKELWKHIKSFMFSDNNSSVGNVYVWSRLNYQFYIDILYQYFKERLFISSNPISFCAKRLNQISKWQMIINARIFCFRLVSNVLMTSSTIQLKQVHRPYSYVKANFKIPKPSRTPNVRQSDNE